MILVIGAGGRIGRHLVPALSKKEKVRVFVKEGERFTEKNIEVISGDLLDIESLKKAVQDCDVVYHLAAIVYYLAPKELVWNVNVQGTKNVIEACREFGVKKIIYLSSTAVYGKKHPNPAGENTPCRPTNFYGKTKLEAEKIVIAHNGIVLRSTDVFGREFEEGYFTVFSMLEKGKMPIIGKGKNRIQYIHIEDLIQALLAAKNKGKPGEIYLVAGKEIKTQEELLEMCSKYLGCSPPKKRTPKWLLLLMTYFYMTMSKLKGKKPKMIPEYIEKLAADRIFDIKKAERELGFRPKKTYEQGIAEMVEEYKKKK